MGKKSQVPAETPKKVAVIMGHWLGDTFWASQTLPILKKKLPDSEIYVILRQDYSPLFHGLIDAENIIIAPELVSDRHREKVHLLRLFLAARNLGKEYNFDWVIDLTGNRYSALFGRLMKPKWFCGFNGDQLGCLYHCRTHIDRAQLKHLSEQPFLALEPIIGKVPAPEKMRPATAAYDKEAIYQRLMLDPRTPVAVIAPGGGWHGKRWGKDNFAQLTKMIAEHDYQTIITGTQNERRLCEDVSSVAGIEARMLCSGDLDELISLLSVADMFVGNDSGPGHLAAAAGSRCILIFQAGGDAKLTGALGENVTICDSSYEFIIPQNIINKIFPAG
jgi:ADP-heptose:LPS heptosyltransferase